MTKTIGEMLDNPVEFYGWMVDETGKFGAVHAVERLGLLSHIGPGPTTPVEVAKRSGLDPEAVRRLIEYLASQGVLDADGEGRFAPTKRSDFLRSISAVTTAGAWCRAVASRLHEGVERGITAYEVEYGQPVFEHFAANPERGRLFGESMSFTTAMTEDQLFASHRFEPFEVAVDIGGSHGSLLLRLLREHSSARGILFDRPETAVQAKVPVTHSGLAERVDIVGGNFFESVPAGGDLYLLKQILHDWNDGECRSILRNVRDAIADGGRLAVIERVIPETFTPHAAYDFDMVMMIWTNGRERRLAEYKNLLEASGFAFERFTETPVGIGVIEAVAA